MDTIPDELWRWLRDELPDERFEQWVYAQGSNLERALGHRTYQELIELDFRDLYAVASLRQRLAVQLPRACLCPLMLDRQRLPLTAATRATADSPFLALFEKLREAPNGAELWCCRGCRSYWLVALDWDADDWYLERLARDAADAVVATDEWPATFIESGAKWPSGHLRWSSSDVAATFRGGLALEMVLQDEKTLTAP